MSGRHAVRRMVFDFCDNKITRVTAAHIQLRSRRLRVLHLVLSISDTNAAYNELCLPMADEKSITICTYFKCDFTPSAKINFLEGDSTLRGFVRVIRKILADDSYDVVHAHSAHVAFFFLFATLLGSGKGSPPVVLTLHSSFPNYKIRHKALLLPAFIAAQRLVCCSRASYESVPKPYRWLADGRLSTVTNGVDIDRVDEVLNCRSEYELNSCFTIVAVGRLIEVKNPFRLLAAFQQCGVLDSRLVIIGDGHLRNALTKDTQTFSERQRIEFHGLLPREKVYQHLAMSDLFISTSHVEGMPIAVLEAMACRCPLVLSDIPAHREIAQGVDFIPLVAPNDVKGFAEQIDRFRRMAVNERAEIGQRCRELVEKRFSLSTMLQGYNATYAEVLHKPNASVR